ncbi:MAG: hypothetical protein HY298_15425 [Verrucomicrobia bacterium]|nr:hypothetical protein [Verrucomicrobiota bacterium]
MTAIAQQLERKLKKWRPTTARKVEKLVTKIIELADQNIRSAKSFKKVRDPRKDDPFFADTTFFNGKVPRDTSLKHDKYLYGDEA